MDHRCKHVETSTNIITIIIYYNYITKIRVVGGEMSIKIQYISDIYSTVLTCKYNT